MVLSRSLLRTCMAMFGVWLCLASLAHAETIRLALVVGNNAGGGDLPPLRYAESDAAKVARVLVELGQVAGTDVVLLQGRTVADLEAGIFRLRTKIAEINTVPENRALLLFYFSGHSDGESIELGVEALNYSRLKSMLAGTGASVRLGIVDACRSGAGFKEKGGKVVEPFAIKMADHLNATGEAFITSSAEDEFALESSEMMGSIFTHNLVSGLRGAADLSGDKLVTLAEAYRYTYEQTVTRTAFMPVGVQHPNYDFRISGQGELVLTSLQHSSATLLIPPGTERAVIIDLLRDQIVAELPAHGPREVALMSGQYGVRLFREGKSYGGRVTLAEGLRKSLRWEDLAPMTASTPILRKGAEIARVQTEKERVIEWNERKIISLGFGIAPSLYELGLLPMARIAFEPRAASGLSFAVMARLLPVLTVAEGAVEGRAGLRAVWHRNFVTLAAGAELGLGTVWTYDSKVTHFSPLLNLSPRVVARLELTSALALGLDLDGGVNFLIRNDKFELAWVPTAILGFSLQF